VAETEANLFKQIHNLYQQLRSEMKARFSRDLPFEEMLFDRWERAQALGFGSDTSIYHNSYVYGNVAVGANTWIGPFTLLDGTGGLSIGSNCSISAGVHIYTHDTMRWALSNGKASYEYASVQISDCCYIGPQTVIAKGVTIGNHVVVGARSFVNRDIAPYSIAVGAPCRVIGKVEIEGEDIHLVYSDNHGDDRIPSEPL
jgi:acetyltransferase-like isoleucine patch superfamily enzyme